MSFGKGFVAEGGGTEEGHEGTRGIKKGHGIGAHGLKGPCPQLGFNAGPPEALDLAPSMEPGFGLRGVPKKTSPPSMGGGKNTQNSFAFPQRMGMQDEAFVLPFHLEFKPNAGIETRVLMPARLHLHMQEEMCGLFQDRGDLLAGGGPYGFYLLTPFAEDD